MKGGEDSVNSEDESCGDDFLEIAADVKDQYKKDLNDLDNLSVHADDYARWAIRIKLVNGVEERYSMK